MEPELVNTAVVYFSLLQAARDEICLASSTLTSCGSFFSLKGSKVRRLSNLSPRTHRGPATTLLWLYRPYRLRRSGRQVWYTQHGAVMVGLNESDQSDQSQRMTAPSFARFANLPSLSAKRQLNT
eukprot:5423690-Amphidinium_carterae.2